MDELTGPRARIALGAGLIFTLVTWICACTVRERQAYEDCVRSRCTQGALGCERVGDDPDAGVVGVRVCTRACEGDEDCPADERTERPGRCVETADGSYCLPACDDPFECFAPLVCDVEAGACIPERL